MGQWMQFILRRLRSAWERRKSWPDLIGWWLLGICSEFCYWALSTASHDLITQPHEHSQDSEGVINIQKSTEGGGNVTHVVRNCNELSSGLLLVCGVVPSVFVYLIFPFLPLYVNLRVVLCVITMIVSLIFFGISTPWWLFMLGVSATFLSLAVCLTTFIRYMGLFHKDSFISAWSSGVGASGLLGSLYYLSLTENGVGRTAIASSMIVIPITISFAFWFLLPKPEKTSSSLTQTSQSDCILGGGIMDWKIKFGILCQVCRKYLMPSAFVFFFQNTINQGLFELIYFNPKFLELPSRVRWLNFVFLFSNMIFKSSGEWFETSKLWLLAIVQGFNMLLMLSLAIYNWINDGIVGLLIIAILVFWEGVIAGLSYVNTYKMMNKELPPGYKDFFFAFTVLSEPIGILMAGLISIGLHRGICSLPPFN